MAGVRGAGPADGTGLRTARSSTTSPGSTVPIGTMRTGTMRTGTTASMTVPSTSTTAGTSTVRTTTTRPVGWSWFETADDDDRSEWSWFETDRHADEDDGHRARAHGDERNDEVDEDAVSTGRTPRTRRRGGEDTTEDDDAEGVADSE